MTGLALVFPGHTQFDLASWRTMDDATLMEGYSRAGRFAVPLKCAVLGGGSVVHHDIDVDQIDATARNDHLRSAVGSAGGARAKPRPEAWESAGK